MPGFPDKYMPFMDEDSKAKLSSTTAKFTYGPLLRYFREQSINKVYDKEPEWRRPGEELLSGYAPRWM
jgi:hydrogenase small subunit